MALRTRSFKLPLFFRFHVEVPQAFPQRQLYGQIDIFNNAVCVQLCGERFCGDVLSTMTGLKFSRALPEASVNPKKPDTVPTFGFGHRGHG